MSKSFILRAESLLENYTKISMLCPSVVAAYIIF